MAGEEHTAYGLYASGVAALISATGIATMMIIGAKAHRLSAYVSAFAVGFLTVAVFFLLLPKAFSASNEAWQYALVGFGVMALAGIGIQLMFAGRLDNAALTFGYASILALGFHSFLDGFVYTASFHKEIVTGVIAVIGLMLHEYPEGIIAFLLLREAGLSSPIAGFGAFLAAGASTVAGAFAGDSALALVNMPPLGALYGAAAGALIYVLLVHLIPHAWRTPKGRGYVAASLGVVVGTASVIFESLMHHH